MNPEPVTIQGCFEQFLKEVSVGRKLTDPDLILFRHFYFGGFDASLQLLADASQLPNAMGLARARALGRERDQYNDWLQRRKLKRKQ